MPYPSPADEERNGGCGPLLLAVLVLLVVFGAVSCVHQASGAQQDVEVTPARTDGPIYDLPQGVGQTIVCDSLNREYLLLTTEQGGVFLMPYLDEDGKQAVMPQA